MRDPPCEGVQEEPCVAPTWEGCPLTKSVFWTTYSWYKDSTYTRRTAQCDHLKTQPHSRQGALTTSPTAEQAEQQECQASRAVPLHRTGTCQGYHLVLFGPPHWQGKGPRGRPTHTHSPWRPAAAAAAHVHGACACSAGACSGCGQQQPAPAAIEQVQQSSSSKQGVSMVSTTPSAPGHCNCWWWLLNMSAAGALPASRPNRCVCFSCTATCKAALTFFAAGCPTTHWSRAATISLGVGMSRMPQFMVAEVPL